MLKTAVLWISIGVIGLTPAVAQDTLTNESVIKMVSAGLGESVIVTMIQTQPADFSLTADSLIALKAAGVSDAVMAAMVGKSAGPAAAAPGTAAADSNATSGPPVAEIGVYRNDNGKWIDVPPEVVNWKTGGVLKSVATAGIVKGDLNGRLNTPASRTRVVTPVEFLIYAPEGVAITEYQLIKLREKKKAREFRTVTGGVLHVSGGAKRDLMSFKSEKIGVRTYTITLSSIGPGEYGFLPPGMQGAQSASAQLGKMYTFSVVE